MSLWPLFHILATIFFLILDILVKCYMWVFKNLSWGLHSFGIIFKTIESIINYISLIKGAGYCYIWLTIEDLRSISCFQLQKKKKKIKQ